MALIKLLFLLALLVVGGGVSYAVAEPKSVAAAPFKGLATKALEVSAQVATLFKDVRTVAATHERKVVSTALHAMMAMEQLDKMPPVTVPTNDMTSFPSSKYPLYPAYLEKKNTEFKYTLSGSGEVGVDPSEVTTDTFLAGILQKLAELKGEEQGLAPGQR